MNWADDIKPDDLPGELAFIAEAIGVKNAIKLVEAFGGEKLYILQPDSAFLPLKKKYIIENKNRTVKELVRATKLSERTVQNILSGGSEPDARQGNLI